MLSTENIEYGVGNKKILNGISAQFEAGKINVILGPNGSGKSSFLKIFSGEIHHFNGAICYGDESIKNLTVEKLARVRAVMSQQTELSFPLTVEEVVMMGRYPHFAFSPTAKDLDICRQAMEKMSLVSFTERNYLTLSGGEKQRVQFARVLAQIWESGQSLRYLFLDEPLNSLDVNYQQEFLQAAKEFADHNTVVIAILHDVNLAIQYADELFFIREGKLVAKGSPAEIISSSLLENVFRVNTTIISNPVTGKPLVIFDTDTADKR